MTEVIFMLLTALCYLIILTVHLEHTEYVFVCLHVCKHVCILARPVYAYTA